MSLCRLAPLAVAGLFALPAPAPAQKIKTDKAEIQGRQTLLPDEKDLARAEYALSRTKVTEIEQAKLAAAEEWVQARFKEWIAGKTATAFATASLARWLDAKLAVSPRPEDRRAALEAYWLSAWLVDEITQSKREAGVITVTQAIDAHWARLDAELALLEAPAQPGGATAPPPDPASELRLAKSRHALEQQSLPKLLQSKAEVARLGLEGRFKEFVAGKIAAEFVLTAIDRFVAAERHVQPAGARTALERALHAAWLVERINRAKYEAAAIPVSQYALALYEYLDLSERWHKTAGTRPVPLSGIDRPVYRNLGGPMMETELAKAQWAMVHEQPGKAAQAKVAAARDQVEARLKEFVAGKTTAEFLADAERMLLEAELALATSKAARLDALERYWKVTWIAEQINRSKHESGSIAVTQYMNTLYQRLHAEWLLARMRDEPDKKGD